MTIGLLPFVVDSTVTQHVLTDGDQSKTDLRHMRMCRVRTRSKREASSQNLSWKISNMLNIPYNFLNGFELISKMTRGTSQSAEIRRSAEKSHVWLLFNKDYCFCTFGFCLWLSYHNSTIYHDKNNHKKNHATRFSNVCEVKNSTAGISISASLKHRTILQKYSQQRMTYENLPKDADKIYAEQAKLYLHPHGIIFL